MEERRKYPRFKLSHPVLYGSTAEKTESYLENTTRTEDVSRGGVRMKISPLIENGKVLTMKIHNPSCDESVEVVARVVWKRGELDDSTLAGLAFTRIGWIESDKLLRPEATTA